MPKIQAPSLAEHHDQAWAALTAAMETLLTERPYEAITMSNVASTAGMARNTLYNYAADKPSLVAAVTERASAALLTKVTALAGGEGPPLDRLEAIVRAILAWFVAEEHRYVVASGLFAGAPASKVDQASAPLKALESQVVGIIEGGIADGRLRRLPDIRFTVQLLSAIAERAVRRVVEDPRDLAMACDETLRVLRACVAPTSPD